jgi:hypothetical protein
MSANLLGSSTAVEKQVDQLEIIVTTFVVTNLVVLFASAAANKDFNLFGAKLETDEAYGFVVATFDCLLLLFFSACWKAGDVFKACSGPEADRAVVAVVTHKWLLNPFSYTGESLLSNLVCAVGSLLLTLAWWVGLCSLELLSSVTRIEGRTERILWSLYLALGALCLVAIGCFWRGLAALVQCSIEEGLGIVSHRARMLFLRSIFAKCAAAVTATILGCWLYYSFGHVA